MLKGFQSTNISLHAGFLNVIFFETNPSKILEIAKAAKSRVEDLRSHRPHDYQFSWLPEAELPICEEEDEGAAFYFPRVFITSGTFDVAAIFLSPTMEMAPWMQVDALRVSGQDINVALLPKKSPLLGSGVRDFNRDFWESYRQEPSRNLEPARAFTGIIKLKINPATWPTLHPNADQQTGQLTHQLADLWQAVDRWRKTTAVAGTEHPEVALAISFGWNEFLIVAHADSPGKLFRLSLAIRQCSTSAPCLADEPKNLVHLLSTTITAVGHDYRIREHCIEELDSRSKARHSISAKEILNLALALPRNHQEKKTFEETGDIPGTFYQIGCHTYPGHEKSLFSLLRKLEDTLKKQNMLTSEDSSCVDIGKRDIWTPRIVIGENYFSPLEATYLVELLHVWIRNGGAGPLGKRTQRGKSNGEAPIRAAFDFYTRLACPRRVNEQNLNLRPVPLNHVTRMPQDYLTPPLVTMEFAQTREDNGFVARLKFSMRILQIPYYLSEQILNLVNTFFWANDRDVIWDESIELIPVVVGLADNVNALRNWWNLGKPTVPLYPWESVSEEQRNELIGDEVGRRLAGNIDPNIPELLHAFRAYFYSRHLSSYLTDEMPDMNIRFRGSVHQLLNISNLILDAMSDRIFGPRASMAIIGDSASPEIETPCDIIVVKLNTNTFTMPIMLESLAHEVGHELILELIRDSVDSGWRRHRWLKGKFSRTRQKNFKRLVSVFTQLHHDVFQTMLVPPTSDNDCARVFIESSSDFVEYQLLAFASVEDWAPSFFLRMVLAGSPSSLGARPEDIGSIVPHLDDKLILSAILRSVHVLLAHRMSTKDWSSLEEFRDRMIVADLAEFRDLLIERCVLGPGVSPAHLLRAESWQHFVRSEVFGSSPLFFSEEGFELACKFYKALAGHARPHPNSIRKDTPERFLSSIQDSFRDLRGSFPQGQEEGDGVYGLLLPSLHIRHWLSAEELRDVRSGKISATGWGTRKRPWVVAPQPTKTLLEFLRDGRPFSPRTSIFQRGQIIPRSISVQGRWTDINSRFLLRLLDMVPSWRVSILRKLEVVLSRSRSRSV